MQWLHFTIITIRKKKIKINPYWTIATNSWQAK